MIASFANRETEALFRLQRVKRIDLSVQRATVKKLWMLEAAANVADLKEPPGNRLESLKGDRAGQYSIRVNDQWRIVFTWRNGQAHDVELVDDH